MEEKLVDKLESIDWSKYAASHGTAADMVEDEVEEDNRPFFKKLFSGPPPKEKVGNVKDFLFKLHSKDEEEALFAYQHLSSAVCRNEFVASSAQPSYPFLMDALKLAVENSNYKLANNLLMLFRAFAINIRRLALYPKGNWGKELETSLKEDLPSFKEHLEVSEVRESAKDLIDYLETEPPKVVKLEESLDWLDGGEIRFVGSSLTNKLETSLQEIGFKVYIVDCGNIEMEMELVNAIASTLQLSDDELNPIENWSWNLFVDTINNEFDFGGASHVAVICTGLSSAITTIKEVILQEVETIAMAVQHRDDTIFSGPIQKEFFFVCDNESLGELNGSEASDSKTEMVCFDPQNIEYFRTKAFVAVEREEFSEAIEFYSKAIELEPEDYSFYRQRAQLYRMLEDYQNAIDDCTKALELDDHAMAHCERARSYIALEKYQEAIDDCQKEIELSSSDEVESWVPYHIMAMAQVELEDCEAAIGNLDKSLKLQVTKDAYITRSYIHHKLGNEEQSENDKVKADEAPIGDPGVL